MWQSDQSQALDPACEVHLGHEPWLLIAVCLLYTWLNRSSFPQSVQPELMNPGAKVWPVGMSVIKTNNHGANTVCASDNRRKKAYKKNQQCCLSVSHLNVPVSLIRTNWSDVIKRRRGTETALYVTVGARRFRCRVMQSGVGRRKAAGGKWISVRRDKTTAGCWATRRRD